MTNQAGRPLLPFDLLTFAQTHILHPPEPMPLAATMLERNDVVAATARHLDERFVGAVVGERAVEHALEGQWPVGLGVEKAGAGAARRVVADGSEERRRVVFVELGGVADSLWV